MVSKTLIKLIDYSIFPAVLLVGAKIISVVFLLKYFELDYTINSYQIILTNTSDFIAINTYSSLFVFIAVLAGLIWVTIKAHLFHDTHINPVLSSRLFNMRMEEIIHDNEVIFSQSFIWLAFSWLSTIMFGVHYLFSLSEGWLFYLALGVSVVCTALLAMDIEREISRDLHRKPTDDNGLGFKSKVISFQQLRKEWD
jgi:hypothetical protein